MNHAIVPALQPHARKCIKVQRAFFDTYTCATPCRISVFCLSFTRTRNKQQCLIRKKDISAEGFSAKFGRSTCDQWHCVIQNDKAVSPRDWRSFKLYILLQLFSFELLIMWETCSSSSRKLCVLVRETNSRSDRICFLFSGLLLSVMTEPLHCHEGPRLLRCYSRYSCALGSPAACRSSSRFLCLLSEAWSPVRVIWQPSATNPDTGVDDGKECFPLPLSALQGNVPN